MQLDDNYFDLNQAGLAIMKLYEKSARYFLGVWFLICAVDGWIFIFSGVHVTGEPQGTFLPALVYTTYFWVFLKIVQSIGAVSLLANYKPVLGLAIITPVSSILCLLYLFEVPIFIPFGVLIVASTAILIRAYSKSYIRLLDDYPR